MTKSKDMGSSFGLTEEVIKANGKMESKMGGASTKTRTGYKNQEYGVMAKK